MNSWAHRNQGNRSQANGNVVQREEKGKGRVGFVDNRGGQLKVQELNRNGEFQFIDNRQSTQRVLQNKLQLKKSKLFFPTSKIIQKKDKIFISDGFKWQRKKKSGNIDATEKELKFLPAPGNFKNLELSISNNENDGFKTTMLTDTNKSNWRHKRKDKNKGEDYVNDIENLKGYILRLFEFSDGGKSLGEQFRIVKDKREAKSKMNELILAEPTSGMKGEDVNEYNDKSFSKFGQLLKAYIEKYSNFIEKPKDFEKIIEGLFKDFRDQIIDSGVEKKLAKNAEGKREVDSAITEIIRLIEDATVKSPEESQNKTQKNNEADKILNDGYSIYEGLFGDMEKALGEKSYLYVPEFLQSMQLESADSLDRKEFDKRQKKLESELKNFRPPKNTKDFKKLVEKLGEELIVGLINVEGKNVAEPVFNIHRYVDQLEGAHNNYNELYQEPDATPGDGNNCLIYSIIQSANNQLENADFDEENVVNTIAPIVREEFWMDVTPEGFLEASDRLVNRVLGLLNIGRVSVSFIVRGQENRNQFIEDNQTVPGDGGGNLYIINEGNYHFSSVQLRGAQPNEDVEEAQPNEDVEEAKPNGNVEETKPNGNVEETKPNGNVEETKPNGNVEEAKPNGNVEGFVTMDEKNKEKIENNENKVKICGIECTLI